MDYCTHFGRKFIACFFFFFKLSCHAITKFYFRVGFHKIIRKKNQLFGMQQHYTTNPIFIGLLRTIITQVHLKTRNCTLVLDTEN